MRLINGIFIFLLLVILSCKKKEFESNPPLSPLSVGNDSTLTISDYYNIKDQKWVLQGYKIGEFGAIIPRKDTLFFLSKLDYKFNQAVSSYNLTPALSTFTLTLNETFIGNITGTIYEYNLKYGIIEGLRFKDITISNNLNTGYYLWLKRI
jgi:hypothetical protein